MIIRKVVGESMSPVLCGGQIVLATRNIKKIKNNDVLIVLLDGREVIKRVIAIKDEFIWIEGDNKRHSADSRKYGWIPKIYAFARVVYPGGLNHHAKNK